MNRNLPLFYLNKYPLLHENEGMDDEPHLCQNPAAAISTYYKENLCMKSKLPNYYQSQMSFVLSNNLFVNQSVPVNLTVYTCSLFLLFVQMLSLPQIWHTQFRLIKMQ